MQDALKDLKDVMAVFAKFKVRAFLSYGAVLGAVREKDFIAWDDDIDIDVVDPIDYKTRKQIGWALQDLGFVNQEISFRVFGHFEPADLGYNGNEKSGIIVCKRNTNFSIFFYEEVDCPTHGKEMVCTPKVGAIPLICMNPKFYQKPDTVKLRGEKFITPGPVKDYLTYVYGNWKVPDQGKHADQWRHLHPNEKFD